MQNNLKSPITGKDNSVLVDKILSQFIIDNYAAKYGVNVSEYFSQNEDIDVFKCLDSQYLFYYPYITGNSLFYEQLAKFDWYYKSEKWDYDYAIHLIKEHTRVLEIGSGYGFFLHKLREKNCQIESVELNQDAAKKLKKEGYEVYNQSLEDFSTDYPEKKYDYICAFQLMEHIPNVGDFLHIFSKHLKENGKLIIGVPNNESVLLNYRVNTLNLPPHHAGLWSASFFKSIPALFPHFELESVSYEPINLNHRWTAAIFQTKMKYKSKSLSFFFHLPWNILASLFKRHEEISMHIIGVMTKNK